MSNEPANDANGHAESHEVFEVVDEEKVRKDELGEIKRRRSNASQQGGIANDTEGDVQNSLVGLSLSGGGLRSGAFSLGVVQSLYARGVLPFVDYLSTVSGGGYAGAYLSSLSTLEHQSNIRANSPGHASEQTGDAPEPNADSERTGDAERTGDSFPIAPLPGGKQSPRMLQFIYGGSYLGKTWTFFNRHLIGLLLIWLLAFSFLITLSSLVAWAFRCLDHQSSRAWLSALGFDGDIALAFFPSFVLFCLWLVSWGLSYFKYGARATGACARCLFFLLITVTAVAVAALLGTGETNVAAVVQSLGLNLTEATIKNVEATMQTLIFTLIGASLLPYLTPKRLLQSGQSQKPLERYTFWFASRALLLGVPFVFMAFFARENISEWNNRRDMSFLWSEVPTALTSPIYHQLTPAADATPAPGNIWQPTEKTSMTSVEAELKELKNLNAAKRELRYSHRITRVSKWDDKSLQEFKLPFLTRWWELAVFAGEWSLGGRWENNPIYEMQDITRQTRDIRKTIAGELNKRLQEPDFYQTLLPDETDDAPDATLEAMVKGETAKGSTAEALAALYAKDYAMYDSKRAPKDSLKAWAAAVLKAKQTARALANSRKKQSGADAKLAEVTQLVGGAKQNKPSNLSSEALRRKQLQTNRMLLRAYYGDVISDEKIVYSSVVLNHDQQTRLHWFFWALIVFFAVAMVMDMNATSAHGFYSSQIARMWIEKLPGSGYQIPLAQLETTAVGRPYHLINTSLHLILNRLNREQQESRGPFLFSKLYCGSARTKYSRTAEYMQGKFALDDAIAISGSAVSPIQMSNPLVLALLFMGNIRLGQWVANPGAKPMLPEKTQKLLALWPVVTPLRLLLSLFQPAEYRPFSFVADGGHYENLGMGALMQRRCRLIIASDASEDPDYRFADFTKLVRWSRVNYGVQIVSMDGDRELVLDDLIANDKTKFSSTHYFIAKIKYPKVGSIPASEGYLIYMKSSLTGDEPFELLQFKNANQAFPHDPTADQFYTAERFESYRRLGSHIADKVCDRLLPESASRAVHMTVGQFIEEIVQPEITSDSELDAWVSILQDHNADPAQRESAAVKLGNSNGQMQSVIPALIHGLESDDGMLAKTCGLALQSFGRPAVDQLREAGLKHASWKVRERVAAVIAELLDESCEIDPETVDALLALLNDRRTSVRKAVARALYSYCDTFGEHPEHEATVNRVLQDLVKLLESEKNAEVCDSIFDTLSLADIEITDSIRNKPWYKKRFARQST